MRLMNEHFLVGDSHGNLPLESGDIFQQLKSMAKLSEMPKEAGLDPTNFDFFTLINFYNSYAASLVHSFLKFKAH